MCMSDNVGVYAYMNVWVYICMHVWMPECMHMFQIYSHATEDIFDIILNKYGCHNANMSCTAIIMLHENTDPTFLHICVKTQATTISTSHLIAMYLPTTNIPLKLHIYSNQFMCTWHCYVSINTSCELTTISNVNRSTSIHTFQITGTCPWTNISAILHIYIYISTYYLL